MRRTGLLCYIVCTLHLSKAFVFANGLPSFAHSLPSNSPQPYQPIETGGNPVSALPRSAAFFSQQYHLLWSPENLKKFLVSTLVLSSIHILSMRTRIVPSALRVLELSPALNKLGQNVILPLIASACCSLQLLLNVFALGCAGFNTLLGPARPYFVSLLAYMSAVTKASVPTQCLRWFTALLPEALHILNLVRERQSIRLRSTGRYRVVASIDIPTMGCVACINKIDASLQNSRDVQSVLTTLKETKGGTAQVSFCADSEQEGQDIAEALLHVVERAGFPGGFIESVSFKCIDDDTDDL